MEGVLSGFQASRRHKRKKSPDCDVTSNSHMPQVGAWRSFCRSRSAVPKSPTATDPALLQSKGERSAVYTPRQRPFSPHALPPRVHPPEKWSTIPATRASALTLGLVTHDGNFEPTEDVPHPTSCYSLTIFTFHSCGGRRSCSTLRTCCDGLQSGCSGFPKPQVQIYSSQQCQNDALDHVEARVTATTNKQLALCSGQHTWQRQAEGIDPSAFEIHHRIPCRSHLG